ncbi:MAG: phasin family protein [Pseudomonadota bacterium]|jgi:phasin family protein
MAKAKVASGQSMDDSANEAAWEFAEQASEFGQQFSAASSKFSEATTQVLQGFERAAEVSKENAEAFVQSLTAAAKSVEVLSAESLSFAKQSVEDGVKAGNAMLAAKSPQDFVKLQGEYTRTAFDQMVNQAAKFNDLGMTAMKNIYSPVAERVTAISKVIQQNRAF